jgi:hypothetical protein
MLSPIVSTPLTALGTALLWGCAALARPSSTAPERQPDCSFRSATTCWTMANRFPARRPDARDSVPSEILGQPATIIARVADTVAASQ